MNRRNWLAGALGISVMPVSSLLAVTEPYPRSGKGLKVGLAAYSFRNYFEWSRGKKNAKYVEGEKSMDVLKFIDYCAAHGAQGAELTSYYFAPSATKADFVACRKRAQGKGVEVSGTAVGNNFSYPKGSPERVEQLAYVHDWVENSVAMGAPHIRVFAGKHPEGVDPDSAEANASSALEEAAVFAGQNKVYLGIENHDSIRNSDRLLRIVKAVKSPWVGVNLDTGNFVSDDVYAEIAVAAPYAVNVQVKTEMRAGADGKGKVPADLERVVKILKDSGYEGFVTLEYEAEADPYEAVPGVLEKLRNWCA